MTSVKILESVSKLETISFNMLVNILEDSLQSNQIKIKGYLDH